ncbi:MAG TPA: AbrB/MazE/SpoVT family DNA-binding domain-containing protein [Terracidiphilus sp.]|nr:AbrB/MazE/SpoVT family DNA-binding domain-containing protein [Terracidiphilus sp.]
MPTATVTSKGQFTIPIEVRKTLGIKPGTKVDLYENERGEYVFRPRTGSIRDLEGCVPKLDHVVTIKEMNDAIADAVAESFRRSVGELPSREGAPMQDEAA